MDAVQEAVKRIENALHGLIVENRHAPDVAEQFEHVVERDGDTITVTLTNVKKSGGRRVKAQIGERPDDADPGEAIGGFVGSSGAALPEDVE